MKSRNTPLACLCFTAFIIMGGALWGCSEPDEDTTEGTVIGETSVDIDTRLVTTYIGEAAIGNFIADVLKEELNEIGHAVDIVFVNAGSIRGGPINDSFEFLTPEGYVGQVYSAGPLTDMDVAGWLPFRNDYHYGQLNGEQLKSILERSAQALPPDIRDQEGGWLLHASGMSYTIECDGQRQELDQEGEEIAVEGQRVTKISIDGNVVYDSAEGVDDLESVSVIAAANSFLFNTGDGHLAFEDATDRTVVSINDFDQVAVVQDYIRNNSPVSPRTDGRLTVVGNCSRPHTTP